MPCHAIVRVKVPNECPCGFRGEKCLLGWSKSVLHHLQAAHLHRRPASSWPAPRSRRRLKPRSHSMHTGKTEHESTTRQTGGSQPLFSQKPNSDGLHPSSDGLQHDTSSCGWWVFSPARLEPLSDVAHWSICRGFDSACLKEEACH